MYWKSSFPTKNYFSHSGNENPVTLSLAVSGASEAAVVLRGDLHRLGHDRQQAADLLGPSWFGKRPLAAALPFGVAAERSIANDRRRPSVVPFDRPWATLDAGSDLVPGGVGTV